MMRADVAHEWAEHRAEIETLRRAYFKAMRTYCRAVCALTDRFSVFKLERDMETKRDAYYSACGLDFDWHEGIDDA